MIAEPKLEPCPMCGSPWTIEGGGGAGYFGACSLKECGLTTALFATKIYAIAASSRRTAPSAGLREECAQAAENAKLPVHFQWGKDAMEQFEFGKKCAAQAIRTMAVSKEKS